MDNHPIPQDVTGFQFKLVGSMTIKQFGYVGVGVVLAVVFFYAPLAWYIKYPLMITLPALGVSLAFLPIAGRPLDLMATYFAKAILKPNQYVYQKTGGSLSFMEFNLQPVLPKPTTSPQTATKPLHSESKKTEQLMSYLYDAPADSLSPLDQKESQLVSNLFNQPVTQQPASVAPLGMQTDLPSIQTPAFLQVTQQDNFSQSPANTQPAPQQPNTHPEVAMQPTPPPTVLEMVSTTQGANNNLSQPSLSPSGGSASGMDFPNLINGIVKDARGNVLPGILVEVLNEDNDSVRAFKTNSLGQFVSATQLTNGPYTITFEDPKSQHKFDAVKIEANGSVLPPLNITSVDAREELRRSLFEQ